MKYSNRPIPEGINTSQTHPLKIFLKLFAALVVVLALMTWLLGKSGAWLAMLIPFDRELSLTAGVEIFDSPASSMQTYLQGLADTLADDLGMPEEVVLHVHYSEEPVVNAFATLGGHVIFYNGLLRELDSENALAMLIAHELAHIKHRDPIASLGQGLAIQTGLKLVLGSTDVGILGNTGLYTQLKFGRDMESAADSEALAAVYHRYGHLGGALDLYEVFLQAQGSDGSFSPSFLATHPLTEKRISSLRNQADKNGWSFEGDRQQLPEDFRRWLQ
ncbi:MAG: M48 family metallopeptidase [Gammaproteobacteria bacterium]|nr:M48 family metallopeptidase [Gammaproteobacteria bacterium]